MSSISKKNTGTITPVKDSSGFKSSKIQELSNHSSENTNPNVSNSSPVPKPSKSSPLTKSAKPQKSAAKNPNGVVDFPRYKIRERKFVVAKKNPKKEGSDKSKNECKCRENGKIGNDVKKCLCVAYETLRASQEGFFKHQNGGVEESNESERFGGLDRDEIELEEEMERKLMIQDFEIDDGVDDGESESPEKVSNSMIKRRRERLLETARNSIPETGCGKVKHLVMAFEKLRTIHGSKEVDQNEEKESERIEKPLEEKSKVMKWALPGLPPPKVPETHASSSSFCPSELFLTSASLGLDSQNSVSSSWDGTRRSFSISSRTSNGGRRNRRNSTESSGTLGGSRWKKKQLKVTSQKPFKLRTEQRGKVKEEELLKRIEGNTIEEERQRIPIAQGLPWTTDEPECLIKPQVKEITRPLDLVLHSDVRAVERAEFDHQVAEKLSLIEQYKMERDRQQKLAEEEEVRRLRKELVPKAQPMPYFDRPFIPRRSARNPTIPKEPKFHIPQQKKIKSCMSWNDMSQCTFQS